MKRVLVAPLDWGLGHATRCIPIIRQLLERTCEVYIAGNGRSLELLKVEFPGLNFFVLAPYDPVYPVSGGMAWKMASQLPKFISTIRREHEQLEEIMREHSIDLVISDNRYGCWSARVRSVFITHQSNILMPERFGWLAGGVRWANERMMKKFWACWIPDLPGDRSLAGTLADLDDLHPSISYRHIGILSRFTRPVRVEKQFDLLCIFSGPEPQRTLLEKIVARQLTGSGFRTAIVRGIPPSEKQDNLDVKAHVLAFASSGELEDLLNRSEVVLARSGFSTVMDLAKLGKKAIFIPTPGQTEQQYLASQLLKKGIAYAIAQDRFDLIKAWEASLAYKGFDPFPADDTLLTSALEEALA
jgi:UDP:flavonoid glycosyltransferase YjiC (YdhE family)